MSYYYRRQHLIPDALFTIRIKGKEHFFLMEMDRGTISAKRMFTRYKAYYDWWRSGGPKSDFGIASIRILTVTVNQKRMENLIRSCYSVKDGTQGSALFWFTTTNHIDVFKPRKLLDRIWLKALPENHSFYRLID